MAELTMIEAIRDAVDIALGSDDRVLVFGEDAGKNGGVFRATDGLQAKYGENRVFNTPLAESGVGGLAIGLALQNFRPVMEIQYFPFVFEVMDSIAGQMSRNRFRTNGEVSMPITVRGVYGGGTATPELHADSLEGLMAQSPGLKTVIPAGPYDAKGLLLASIRDNDPVVFLEHMVLYRSFREEVPEEDYEIELGKAHVRREGSDVTIVTYGKTVLDAEKAADALAEKGISAEVIDLRTVYPIDVETIVKSVEKTGRVVVAQEAQRQAGVGEKVISEIAQRAMFSLEAPVGFVAAPNSPYPFVLAEKAWLPDENDIVAKVNEIMEY